MLLLGNLQVVNMVVILFRDLLPCWKFASKYRLHEIVIPTLIENHCEQLL